MVIQKAHTAHLTLCIKSHYHTKLNWLNLKKSCFPFNLWRQFKQKIFQYQNSFGTLLTNKNKAQLIGFCDNAFSFTVTICKNLFFTCTFFPMTFVQYQEITMPKNVGYTAELIANYC